MSMHTIEAKQFNDQHRNEAIKALEQGNVIYLPNISFELFQAELEILNAELVAKHTKNISFNPNNNRLGGLRNDKFINNDVYLECMRRYFNTAKTLFTDLFPSYTQSLQIGRTSLRPVEIAGRTAPSYRKDDTLLHVDAFPSSPNQGRRIIRVFSNVNPDQKPRVWHIGEPFGNVAARFMPKIKHPIPGTAQILNMLGITKTKRSKYDHYMLQIHDSMKADQEYQRKVDKLKFEFPAGSSWIVLTDQVSHAALSGQHVFEQTFYLPVTAMQNPSLSPYSELNKYVKL